MLGFPQSDGGTRGRAEVQRLAATDPCPGGLLHAMLARGTLPSLGFGSRGMQSVPLKAPATGVQRLCPASDKLPAPREVKPAIAAPGGLPSFVESARKRIRLSLGTRVDSTSETPPDAVGSAAIADKPRIAPMAEATQQIPAASSSGLLESAKKRIRTSLGMTSCGTSLEVANASSSSSRTNEAVGHLARVNTEGQLPPMSLIASAHKRIRNSISALFHRPVRVDEQSEEPDCTPGRPQAVRKASFRNESPGVEKALHPLSTVVSGKSNCTKPNAAKEKTPQKKMLADTSASESAKIEIRVPTNARTQSSPTILSQTCHGALETSALSPSAAVSAGPTKAAQEPRGQKRKKKTPPPRVPLFSPAKKKEDIALAPCLQLKRLPLPPKRLSDNYEISDKEDSEDECMEEPDRSMKHVPVWSEDFQEAILQQADVEPDSIFGRVPACDLDIIFPDSLYRTFGRQPRKRPRGSSCRWDADKLTSQEVTKYARKMGQCRRWSKLCRSPALKASASCSSGAAVDQGQ